MNLVTINHPPSPATQRSTYCAPSSSGRAHGWAVSLMPGVTIGENAVVAANADVMRDMADNAVVGEDAAARHQAR